MSQHNGGGGWGSAGGRGQRFGGKGSGRNSRGKNCPSWQGTVQSSTKAIYPCGDDKQSERHTKTTDKVLNCIFAKSEHQKHTKEHFEKLQACAIEQWRPEKIEDGTELGEVEKMTL